jgi:hypothetical protein
MHTFMGLELMFGISGFVIICLAGIFLLVNRRALHALYVRRRGGLRQWAVFRAQSHT